MDADLQVVSSFLQSPSGTGLVVGSLTIAALVLYLLRKPSIPLPPSPPSSWSIFGHAKLVDDPHPCKIFSELSKSLGDIIYVNAYGRHNIFLQNIEDARELLDRRSANYSSRPRSVLMADMHGWGDMLFIRPYSDRYRALRRMFMQGFNAQASRDYHEIQAKQAVTYLKKVMETPDQFEQMMLAAGSATVLKSVFGYDLGTENDKFTAEGIAAAESLFSVGVPGSRIVDYYPLLRFLPSWIPGMSWKARAAKERHLVDNILNVPYNDITAKRASGDAPPSVVNRLIDHAESEGLMKDEIHVTNIKNTAGVAFLGAVETTDALVMAFVMMMTLYPEAAKKAQEEIDRVIGPHRLPDLQDRPNLPYIDCIIKETSRFCPPLEIDTPHVTLEDDVYKGMFIPKGTSVHANIWAYGRDKRFFPDADVFRPERYMEKVKSTESYERVLNSYDPADPTTFMFGFGRRICPGRFFADSNAWILCSNILAVFDISQKKDPLTGKNIVPKLEFTSGFTNHAVHFDFEIKPRNERCAKLINDLAA